MFNGSLGPMYQSMGSMHGGGGAGGDEEIDWEANRQKAMGVAFDELSDQTSFKGRQDYDAYLRVVLRISEEELEERKRGYAEEYLPPTVFVKPEKAAAWTKHPPNIREAIRHHKATERGCKAGRVPLAVDPGELYRKVCGPGEPRCVEATIGKSRSSPIRRSRGRLPPLDSPKSGETTAQRQQAPPAFASPASKRLSEKPLGGGKSSGRPFGTVRSAGRSRRISKSAAAREAAKQQAGAAGGGDGEKDAKQDQYEVGREFIGQLIKTDPAKRKLLETVRPPEDLVSSLEMLEALISGPLPWRPVRKTTIKKRRSRKDVRPTGDRRESSGAGPAGEPSPQGLRRALLQQNHGHMGGGSAGGGGGGAGAGGHNTDTAGPDAPGPTHRTVDFASPLRRDSMDTSTDDDDRSVSTCHGSTHHTRGLKGVLSPVHSARRGVSGGGIRDDISASPAPSPAPEVLLEQEAAIANATANTTTTTATTTSAAATAAAAAAASAAGEPHATANTTGGTSAGSGDATEETGGGGGRRERFADANSNNNSNNIAARHERSAASPVGANLARSVSVRSGGGVRAHMSSRGSVSGSPSDTLSVRVESSASRLVDRQASMVSQTHAATGHRSNVTTAELISRARRNPIFEFMAVNPATMELSENLVNDMVVGFLQYQKEDADEPPTPIGRDTATAVHKLRYVEPNAPVISLPEFRKVLRIVANRDPDTFPKSFVHQNLKKLSWRQETSNVQEFCSSFFPHTEVKAVIRRLVSRWQKDVKRAQRRAVMRATLSDEHQQEIKDIYLLHALPEADVTLCGAQSTRPVDAHGVLMSRAQFRAMVTAMHPDEIDMVFNSAAGPGNTMNLQQFTEIMQRSYPPFSQTNNDSLLVRQAGAGPAAVDEKVVRLAKELRKTKVHYPSAHVKLVKKARHRKP